MALLWASAPSLCAWAPSARGEHSALVAPGPQAQTLSPGIASHHITIHHTSSHVPPTPAMPGLSQTTLACQAKPKFQRDGGNVAERMAIMNPTTLDCFCVAGDTPWFPCASRASASCASLSWSDCKRGWMCPPFGPARRCGRQRARASWVSLQATQTSANNSLMQVLASKRLPQSLEAD